MTQSNSASVSYSLNVNAAEWTPPVGLLNKMHLQDHRNNSALNSSYTTNLRACLLTLFQDDSLYAVRIAQFMESIVNKGITNQLLDEIADELINFAEEHFSRSGLAARVSYSLSSGIPPKPTNPTKVLIDRVLHRSIQWRSQPNWDQQPEALAFMHYLAGLYNTMTPRSQQLSSELCLYLEAAIRKCGPLFGPALGLAERNMSNLVADWVQLNEKSDAELESLVNALRDLLTLSMSRGNGILTPQAALSALSALENRAAELAKARLYRELNLSREGSELGDDIYDDYEKFLMETGQM